MNSTFRCTVSHILIHVIVLLTLSTVAHIGEETTASQKEPINNNVLKGAIFKADSRQELCRRYKAIWSYDILYPYLLKIKRLFVKRRQQHAKAIERLQKIDNYERSYKMILLLMNKIIEVIESNKTLIENFESIFSPGIFPQNDDVLDALSTILENAAFFGDIVLHFPDIAHRILKTQQEWNRTIQWSLNFTNRMKHLLDKFTMTVIDLVRQELNITKRVPEYFNPYQLGFANYKKGNDVSKNKKVRNQKQKKGPRMVKIEL